MTTTTQHPALPAHRAGHRGRPRRSLLLGVGAPLVGALGLLAVVIGAATHDPVRIPAGTEQVRSVTASGPALPAYQAGLVDRAVGSPAPVVSGRTFSGAPLTIGGAGEPELIMFVAHWCPHCQAEVPVVTSWIGKTGLPEGVRLAAVSTAASADQPNYPPSAWLEREHWPVTTLADNSDADAARLYGLSSFPYFVALGADGTVVARASGELSVTELEGLMTAARNGVAGPVVEN